MKKNISKLFQKSINNKITVGHKKDGNWKWISKEYLNNMINNSIQILKDNSIKKGDRIAYKGKNSVEWISWNLATHAMGGIWVPMYPQQNLSYCQHIVNDCQPKLLITDEDFKIENTRILGNKIENLNYTNNDYQIIDNDISTLVYTSGTTGKPKGVILTHDNIISNIETIQKRFPDLSNVTTLNILPWAHIYGLTCELYYNLLNDNRVALASSKEDFIKECRQVKPDVLFVVPKLLELIKNKLSILDKPVINNVIPYVLKQLFGGNIITLFCGGAKLDKATRDFFLDNGINISEGYGCSETSPMISLNHHIDPRNIDSLGKILDNLVVEIINKEVCVSGPSIMNGYWNNLEATNEAFIKKDGRKYYRTGDSGYIKDDFLYLTGRISENYKMSNGKFVNVGELEEAIKEYIKTNFIIYGENMDYNILIVEKPFNNKLLQKINNNIESYMAIKEVVQIESKLMEEYLTPKMSIKRKALLNHLKNNEIIKK